MSPTRADTSRAQQEQTQADPNKSRHKQSRLCALTELGSGPGGSRVGVHVAVRHLHVHVGLQVRVGLAGGAVEVGHCVGVGDCIQLDLKGEGACMG